MKQPKVFLDSPAFIYLLERNPEYHSRVKSWLIEAVEDDIRLCTSVLTLHETLIKPTRLNQFQRIEAFESTLKTLAEVEPITWDIAKLSANLRAKYTSLKAVDSLQIACAIKANADGFLTNDRRLRFIKEIQIILIKDL